MNKVELVQKGYQHFSEGDIAAVLALFHPEIIWDECQGFPFIKGDGIFKGPDAIAQGVFSQLPAHYAGFSIDIQELFGCGEKVVMVGHYRGIYKETGKQFKGLPQNELKGGGDGLFATLYADPARLKEFLAAMTGVSRGANMAIANKFPWESYKHFADIGTAQGDLAVQVALAHPHLSGIGFDLPEVEPIFEEYALQNGLSERLRFVGGDFFNQPLPNADVLMMGHILHDWNLEEKKQLIRKAYEALPEGGALVVYESIIDDARSKNAFGLLLSLNMLIETPGGFDYTGADCTGWMQEIGFKETRVEHLVGPDSMVIGIK